PVQSGSGRRHVLFVEEVLQLPQKMMAVGSISLQSLEVMWLQWRNALDQCQSLEGVRPIKHCHKLDRKEFSKVAVYTTIRFMVIGQA
ncbi:unnamed protein product, partial [Musa banksii]